MRAPSKESAAALAIFASLIPAIGYALDPGRAITQYGHDVWRTEQGLPQSSVQAILQTRDAYIWFGTEEGLARFDGVRFTVFDKRNATGLADSFIAALVETSDGALWIGTRSGGLTRYSNGTFTKSTALEGLLRDHVRCLARDRQGDLWIGTDAGLTQISGSQVRTLSIQDGLSSSQVRVLAAAPDGSLWIGTRTSGLNVLRQGRISALGLADGLPSDEILALRVTGDGTVWVGTSAGLSRYRNGRFTTFATKDGLPTAAVTAILEDRDGNLWIGTDGGGLARFRNAAFTTYTAKQGLSNDYVLSLFEDREGSLWVGTQGGGLNRFKDQKFAVFSSKEGLSRDAAWSIYADRSGGVWIGTLGGGLDLLKDGRVTVYTKKDGLPGDAVWSTLQDRDGSLWVGTRRNGLARGRNGRFAPFGAKEGLGGRTVISLLQDRSGAVFIGTTDGLFRYGEGRITSFAQRDGLGAVSVLSLLEDRGGTIWIGTRAAGVSRLAEGRLTNLMRAQGLPNDTVYDIHEDSEGDIWLATAGGGLARWTRGALRSYGTKEGLHDDVIYRILDDGAGNFWMSCNRGVFRVARKDFDRFDARAILKIPSVPFSQADGMRSPECNGGFQPAGWRTPDGRLWFPTVDGAAVIDPHRIPTNAIPPPVLVEGLVVDTVLVPLGAPPRLPPGKGSFEFRYTALSFVAPEKVLFRYRLEGFDPDWVDAGTRRAAYYTNLPPGDYTFRVTACNDSGLWNTAGASLSFRLEPRFRQTWWFYLMCAAAAALAGEGLYLFRIRQMRARQVELEGLVAQRTAQLQETNRDLERLSLVDPLTGIANRRQFERVLDAERKRSERNAISLSLVMCDLDFFKRLNDVFGHVVGDACLKRVAETLSRCVRGAGDLVARYGGEEFAVILPGASVEGAAEIANRIRAGVEALHIPRSETGMGEIITISLGVATAGDLRNVSAGSLVARADEALYLAKTEGRNRVVVAEPLS